MKYLFFKTFVISSLFISQPQTATEIIVEIPPEPPKIAVVEQKPIIQPEPPVPQVKEIQSIIKAKSAEYGVDPIIPIVIIQNESQYDPKAKGDKNYVCERTGEIAPSHGLVQINECWHPEVTLEQAHDVEFAVEFLVKALSEGKCKLWSTCPLGELAMQKK